MKKFILSHQRKLIFTFSLLLVTWLLIQFNLYPIYKKNISTIIAIFIILLLFLITLIWKDKLRHKVFRVTLIDLISINRYYFFIFCILLSMVFLNYYNLSSQSSDNILPEKLKFNVIEISATLGGLVLAAASLNARRIKNNIRKRLLHVSIKLIAATILLIFYTAFTYWAYKDGSPILFSWDFSSLENILRGSAVIISVICFFIGHPLFLMGSMDLIYAIYLLVRTISKK